MRCSEVFFVSLGHVFSPHKKKQKATERDEHAGHSRLGHGPGKGEFVIAKKVCCADRGHEQGGKECNKKTALATSEPDCTGPECDAGQGLIGPAKGHPDLREFSRGKVDAQEEDRNGQENAAA